MYTLLICDVFFFFQAEDGIRDIGVTGVQTCALPIYLVEERQDDGMVLRQLALAQVSAAARRARARPRAGGLSEIGRASCRERVQISVVAVSLKKKKESNLVDHSSSARHRSRLYLVHI